MAKKTESEKTTYLEKRLEIKIDLGGFCNVTGSCSMAKSIEYSSEEEFQEKSQSLRERVEKDLVEDITFFLNKHNLSERARISLGESVNRKKVDLSILDDDLDNGLDNEEKDLPKEIEDLEDMSNLDLSEDEGNIDEDEGNIDEDEDDWFDD